MSVLTLYLIASGLAMLQNALLCATCQPELVLGIPSGLVGAAVFAGLAAISFVSMLGNKVQQFALVLGSGAIAGWQLFQTIVDNAYLCPFCIAIAFVNGWALSRLSGPFVRCPGWQALLGAAIAVPAYGIALLSAPVQPSFGTIPGYGLKSQGAAGLSPRLTGVKTTELGVSIGKGRVVVLVVERQCAPREDALEFASKFPLDRLVVKQRREGSQRLLHVRQTPTFLLVTDGIVMAERVGWPGDSASVRELWATLSDFLSSPNSANAEGETQP